MISAKCGNGKVMTSAKWISGVVNVICNIVNGMVNIKRTFLVIKVLGVNSTKLSLCGLCVLSGMCAIEKGVRSAI